MTNVQIWVLKLQLNLPRFYVFHRVKDKFGMFEETATERGMGTKEGWKEEEEEEKPLT